MTSMAWARALGWCLLAWCLGVALQLQQVELWPVMGYGVGFALACAWVWALHRGYGGQRWRRMAWAMLWVWTGFVVTGLHAHSRSSVIAPELEGVDLDVVGLVQAMPQRQAQGWRFRFALSKPGRWARRGLCSL